MYSNKLVSSIIIQQRSELSSLQPASSVQKKKDQKTPFFLNPSDTLADRWRGADHTAGGNTLVLTSAYIPAQRKEQGSHRPCPYALLLCDVFKTGISMTGMISARGIQR